VGKRFIANRMSTKLEPTPRPYFAAFPYRSPSLVSFGYGPRICIGATFPMAEAQIMMASAVSRFATPLHDPRPRPARRDRHHSAKLRTIFYA
jgi:cytochrome P450